MIFCRVGPLYWGKRLFVGGRALDQSLTVVLPMYNCERQLRSSVLDILDLSSSIRTPLTVVVVDDGSTDETYETACELARSFPQVIVLRQSVRQGLGAALELVRNRMAVEMVVVHDGVSPIDAAELQPLLQASDAAQKVAPVSNSRTESHGSRRFAAVRSLHNRMEQAHRSATCFSWMQLDKPLVPRRSQAVTAPPLTQPMLAPGIPVQLANIPMGMNSSTQS